MTQANKRLQVKGYYLWKALKKKEQQNPICHLSKQQQSVHCSSEWSLIPLEEIIPIQIALDL